MIGRCALITLLFVFTSTSVLAETSGAQASTTLKARKESSAGKGAIQLIDLAARTVQINQTVYGLSDNLSVYSASDNSLSQMVLSPNQKIEFWVEYKSAQPSITKIVVLDGFNEGSMPKH